MKLYRPYVPIAIRVQVAERQLRQSPLIGASCLDRPDTLSGSAWLAHLLLLLFDVRKYELHHRPALCNRRWVPRKSDYDPPANDPEHLVYLAEDEHDIETRVRGVGAQRSDLGQRNYLKRVKRNRENVKRKGRSVKSPSVNKSTAKRKWPSRPFPRRKP
jgi:hypothetical protein